jgi:maltose-binding protein MalE
LQPMFSYFGWAVSKQSQAKVAAVNLALWLSGDEVQMAFALSDFTLPSSRAAWKNPEIAANSILDTYHRQTLYGMQPPTIRATSMVFEQLDTALELTYKGEMEAQEALDEANATLIRILGR